MITKGIFYIKIHDEERYPDFKLYKMIVRKVHNHIPEKELKHKYFDKFIVPKKEIKKGSKILNIDTINLDSLLFNMDQELFLHYSTLFIKQYK